MIDVGFLAAEAMAMNAAPHATNVATAILAGGHARRLDGAVKATLVVAGHPLLARVSATLMPQSCATVLCVAPRHVSAAWVKTSELPVVVDSVDDGGPLAGIAAAMIWVRATIPGTRGVVSVPVDEPFVPHDLVARLAEAASADSIAVAESGHRRHYAVAYWPLSLTDELTAFIAGNGDGAIHRWQSKHNVVAVPWAAEPYDPFFNVNTADDLRAAAEIAARRDSIRHAQQAQQQ
jgi:molybdopterin-guanine dinucleotide biosynthesis protein A